MSRAATTALPARPIARRVSEQAAVEAAAEEAPRRSSVQDSHLSLSSDALLPTAARDNKKPSPSPTPAGGALAMLARSSLGMGLGDATTSSTSLDQYGGVKPSESGHSINDENAKPGESSNIIIGPNGILIPKSSILLNPSKRKSLVDSWRTFETDGSPHAPAVLQIPAVPSAKDREAERERQKLEREREIEREWREKEQAEKVWGIPKKAFYMGLGEINFNAQMAMLAGWGNGSGGLYDFRPTPTTALHRLRKQPSQASSSHRKSSSHGSHRSSSGRHRRSHARAASEKSSSQSHHTTAKADTKQQKQPRPHNEPRHDDSSDSDESMDLGELAGLNAIINTRRSMEAAQILAKGEARPIAKKRSVSSDHAPGIRDSHASTSPGTQTSMTGASVKSDATPNHDAVASSQTSMQTKASKRPDLVQSISDQPVTESSRVRFAPLPFAYGPLPPASPTATRSGLAGDASSDGHNGAGPGSIDGIDPMFELGRRSEDGSFTSGALSDDKSIISERSDADSDDEDAETWSKRGASSKPKWYLMGMPKGVFLSSSKRPKRSSGAFVNAGPSEYSSSPTAEKRLSGTFSDGERQSRRRGRTRTTSSRASSVKSRSSSVGSFDEEDRMRRRQLIRSTRPGGTGMVTLPDGSRIRARRVGEEDSDEELQQHWGFARLVREAQRQQKDVDDDDEQKAPGDDTAANGDMDVDETIDDTLTTPAAEAAQKLVATSPVEARREQDSDMAASSEFGRAADEADGITSAKRRRRDRGRAATMFVTSSSNDESYAKRQDASVGDYIASPASKSQDSLQQGSSDDLRASPTFLEAEDEMSQYPTASSLAVKSAEAARGPKRSVTLPTGPITLSASQAAEVRRRHEREVLALGNEVLENMAKAKKARQQAEQSERARSKEPSDGSRNALSLHTSPVEFGSPKQGPMSPSQGSNDSRQERGRERRPALRAGTYDDQRPVLDSRRQLLSSLSLARGSSGRRAGGLSDINAIAEDDERPSAPQTGASTPMARRSGRPSTPLNDRVVVRSVDASPSPTASRRHSLATTHDAKQMSELASSVATLRNLSKLEERTLGSGLSGSPLDTDDTMLVDTVVVDDSADRLQTPPAADEQVRMPVYRSPPSEPNVQRSRSGRRLRTMLSPQELPRRPDQRGYAVVPLPYDQLGRRPLRPMHGRFWQSDPQDDEDDAGDDDTDDEEEDQRQSGSNDRRASHSSSKNAPAANGRLQQISRKADEDSSDSELDAEELAEEERRTAQQKNRATTRAAGAEVVRSTAAHRKSALSPVGRSMSKGREKMLSNPSGYFTSPNGHPTSTPSKLIGAALKSDDETPAPSAPSTTAVDEVTARLQALPLDSQGEATSSDKVDDAPRIDVFGASRDSQQRKTQFEETLKTDTESDDDADLWPPTLANALGTTPATSTQLPSLLRMRSGESRYTDGSLPLPRRASQSSSYGMSTSPGSIKTPSQERPSLRLRAVSSFDMAAHAAKSRAARIKRGARQRAAALSATEQKNGWGDRGYDERDVDDESIDYGWPKSLQGSSLY